MPQDFRRHQRRLADAKLQLSWTTEEGQSVFARGRCVNISQSGMRISIADKVPLRTIVNFQVEGLRFRGSGTVRSCTRIGLSHQVGLEFSGGLKWTALDVSDETPVPSGQ